METVCKNIKNNLKFDVTCSSASVASLGAFSPRDLDQPNLILELLGRFLLDLPGQRWWHPAGRTWSGVKDSVEALAESSVGPEARGLIAKDLDSRSETIILR